VEIIISFFLKFILENAGISWKKMLFFRENGHGSSKPTSGGIKFLIMEFRKYFKFSLNLLANYPKGGAHAAGNESSRQRGLIGEEFIRIL